MDLVIRLSGRMLPYVWGPGFNPYYHIPHKKLNPVMWNFHTLMPVLERVTCVPILSLRPALMPLHGLVLVSLSGFHTFIDMALNTPYHANCYFPLLDNVLLRKMMFYSPVHSKLCTPRLVEWMCKYIRMDRQMIEMIDRQTDRMACRVHTHAQAQSSRTG